MGVSKNRGVYPKSWILRGFSIINHPFWDSPIFGNTHIYIYILRIHTKHYSTRCTEIHCLDTHGGFFWTSKWGQRSTSKNEITETNLAVNWPLCFSMAVLHVFFETKDMLHRSVLHACTDFCPYHQDVWNNPGLSHLPWICHNPRIVTLQKRSPKKKKLRRIF